MKYVPLAGVLLLEEHAATYEFVFNTFHKVFGRLAPNIFFSDGGPGMLSAFNTISEEGGIWFETRQQRCSFHLWKNFFQRFHPYYMHSKLKWRKVAARFWKFIFETSSVLEISFEAEFIKFTNEIMKHIDTFVDNAIKKNTTLSSKKAKTSTVPSTGNK